MGRNSKISWCRHTWNLVWGCQRVSPACDFCYAAELDKRYHGNNSHWDNDSRKIMSDAYWKDPIKWNREAEQEGKPALVFCSSMADVFEKHDTVESQRQRLWPLIEVTPWLRWLLLTKRPQNIKRMLPKSLWNAPNIWLGTTIESGDYLWRADAVCEVPAPVHFVSAEPLLGQLSMEGKLGQDKVNWLIFGTESGNHARPTPIDWYRQLRDQALEAGIPPFFKQAPMGVAGITSGEGSVLKLGARAANPETGKINSGIVEKPYLDGIQYVNYPVVA